MGIAGITGAPGDMNRSLAALLSPAITDNPQNVRTWDSAAGKFGICGHATKASGHPGQPEYLLLLDGRIHNRSELFSKLNLSAHSLSDAELLLQTYIRFGDEFLAHAVGEFSCALWDALRRRCILGRDAIGARSMYYWHGSGTVRFATEMHGLLACPEIPIAPDDAQAALWLMRCPGLGDRTLFEGIKRVPAGHVLIVGDGTLRLHRYWKPESITPIHRADPREYAVELLHQLQQAVQCRLQDGHCIGMQLSGGLDSSTITALAGELLGEQGRRATAFTAVPADVISPLLPSNRFADERVHAASVVERYPNIGHVLIPNNAVPLFQALDNYADSRMTPIINPLNSPWLLGIDMEAQRRGVRILLRATSGNLTASYKSDPYVLGGLLASGKLFEWSRLVLQRKMFGFPLKHSLGATLSRTAGWRWLRKRNNSGGYQGNSDRPGQEVFAASAIHPEFLLSQDLPQQLFHETYNHLTDTRQDRLQGFSRIDRAVSYSGSMRSSGIELTDPMSDRRLLEYCLSVPDEAFCRNGQSRALIRDAMNGRLPDLVRNEYRRGKQAADAASMLERNRAEIIEEVGSMSRSELANRYLDMPALLQLTAAWPAGGWPNTAVKQDYEQKLMRGISFGRFIRRFEDGSLFSSLR